MEKGKIKIRNKLDQKIRLKKARLGNQLSPEKQNEK